MTQFAKTVFLLISGTSLLTSQSAIATEYESPLIDSNSKQPLNEQRIVGYYPYLLSVGTVIGERVDGKLVTKRNAKKLSVGDLLLIPRVGDVRERPNSIPDNYNPDMLYRFVDKDGDMNVDTDSADEMIRIEWFILASDNWDNVNSWSDITTKTRIPDTYIDYLTESDSLYKGTNVLEIPPEAAGKRIGFTYIPESDTGLPRFGSKLYVWDLGHFFGQHGPSQPGWPLENNNESAKEGNPESFWPDSEGPYAGDPMKPGDPGFRGEINPNMPKDVMVQDDEDNDVTFSELTVVFKDENGDELNANEQIYVNHTYTAEVTLPNNQHFTQEMLKNGELSWVLYRFKEPNAECNATDLDVRATNLTEENCFHLATYEYAPDNSTSRVQVVEINDDGMLITTFTTQKDNYDADSMLQAIPPDYSEQGFWFEIRFDDKQDELSEE